MDLPPPPLPLLFLPSSSLPSSPPPNPCPTPVWLFLLSILVHMFRVTLWAVPGSTKPHIKQSLPFAPNKSCGTSPHNDDRAVGAVDAEEASAAPSCWSLELPVSQRWEAMSTNSSCDQQRAAAAWGRPRKSIGVATLGIISSAGRRDRKAS